MLFVFFAVFVVLATKARAYDEAAGKPPAHPRSAGSMTLSIQSSFDICHYDSYWMGLQAENCVPHRFTKIAHAHKALKSWSPWLDNSPNLVSHELLIEMPATTG